MINKDSKVFKKYCGHFWLKSRVIAASYYQQGIQWGC